MRVGDAAPNTHCQRLYRDLRQTLLAHIVKRRVGDLVADSTGTQQLQKVDPALALGGLKPRKIWVANLRHVAVLALMARAGVIDADIGGAGQSSLGQRILPAMKIFLPAAQ